MQEENRTSPFFEQVRTAIRVRHYSIRTEQAYLEWVRRFALYHGKRHPVELGETGVSGFLSYLAVNRNVAASMQNQALNALVFLCVYLFIWGQSKNSCTSVPDPA